jgi:hypothetical protein
METPILIPSFSSKGFRVDRDGKSEVRELLEFTSEWLTESLSTRLLGPPPLKIHLAQGPTTSLDVSGGATTSRVNWADSVRSGARLLRSALLDGPDVGRLSLRPAPRGCER